VYWREIWGIFEKGSVGMTLGAPKAVKGLVEFEGWSLGKRKANNQAMRVWGIRAKTVGNDRG